MNETGHGIRFSVLGPLQVERDGAALSVGGPKQRLLLGLLLLGVGRVVSTDRLTELLFDASAAERATATLHVYVAKLRRSLDGDGASGRSLVETVRPGYRIDVDSGSLDLLLFTALAEQARHLMVEGAYPAASKKLREALDLQRGPLLADLDAHDAINEESTHHDRMVAAVTLDAYECELHLGRHHEATNGLSRLLDERPLDERLCALLMLALYRGGRQVEAMDVARRLRATLIEELGVEPGPEIRNLERRILNHDEVIAAPRFRVGDTFDGRSTVVRASLTTPTGSIRIGQERIPLTRTVTTIGRRSDHAITLRDEDVSRNHAELRTTSRGFLLLDVGSTNGTRVNGARVAEHLLVSGDVIEVGSTTMVFEQDSDGPSRAGP